MDSLFQEKFEITCLISAEGMGSHSTSCRLLRHNIVIVDQTRTSGRKARRQGRLKVVTVVMLKGRLVADFCSPASIWH
jgi:hypothetical protein